MRPDSGNMGFGERLTDMRLLTSCRYVLTVTAFGVASFLLSAAAAKTISAIRPYGVYVCFYGITAGVLLGHVFWRRFQ